MVVQNRCFAALAWDKQIREICQAHDIIYQGFSLLTANREVLVDPQVQKIARRLGATSAQIIFRFAMQIGMLPLTGTTSQQHMREDLEAERFELSNRRNRADRNRSRYKEEHAGFSIITHAARGRSDKHKIRPRRLQTDS